MTRTDPPCVLAIETSTERCSVALAHGSTLVQRRWTGGERVAETALAMTADLLAQQRVSLDQVEAFAFASGPGAFTGLRVACGLVQGLAFARSRPVVPIGSLRALAFAAGRCIGPVDDATPRNPFRVMVATDARMGQVYWAAYQGWPLRALAAAALSAPDALAEQVALWRPDVIAGNALRLLESVWPAPPGAIRMPDLTADAVAVAELARVDLAEGLGVAARDAAPEYVRNQVALTVAQRKGAEAGSRQGSSRESASR